MAEVPQPKSKAPKRPAKPVKSERKTIEEILEGVNDRSTYSTQGRQLETQNNMARRIGRFCQEIPSDPGPHFALAGTSVIQAMGHSTSELGDHKRGRNHLFIGPPGSLKSYALDTWRTDHFEEMSAHYGELFESNQCIDTCPTKALLNGESIEKLLWSAQDRHGYSFGKGVMIESELSSKVQLMNNRGGGTGPFLHLTGDPSVGAGDKCEKSDGSGERKQKRKKESRAPISDNQVNLIFSGTFPDFKVIVRKGGGKGVFARFSPSVVSAVDARNHFLHRSGEEILEPWTARCKILSTLHYQDEVRFNFSCKESKAISGQRKSGLKKLDKVFNAKTFLFDDQIEANNVPDDLSARARKEGGALGLLHAEAEEMNKIDFENEFVGSYLSKPREAMSQLAEDSAAISFMDQHWGKDPADFEKKVRNKIKNVCVGEDLEGNEEIVKVVDVFVHENDMKVAANWFRLGLKTLPHLVDLCGPPEGDDDLDVPKKSESDVSRILRMTKGMKEGLAKSVIEQRCGRLKRTPLPKNKVMKVIDELKQHGLICTKNRRIKRKVFEKKKLSQKQLEFVQRENALGEFE